MRPILKGTNSADVMSYYHALIRHEFADDFDQLPTIACDEIVEAASIVIIKSTALDVYERAPWYRYIVSWQWWKAHHSLWKTGAKVAPLLDSLLPFVRQHFQYPEQILQDSALRVVADFRPAQVLQETTKLEQLSQGATIMTEEVLLPDRIIGTIKQDTTEGDKGGGMKIVENGVVLVSMGLWVVIGFLFWVPLLFRTTASFAGLILYYTISNQNPTHLHVSLEAAINFYARGFQMISSTFNQKSHSTGNGATLFPANLNRLALEMAWVLLFWGITYYLFSVRH